MTSATLTYRQPRLVALILLVLISAGLSAALTMGRQEDPSITNLFATVTTAYPGADPGRVEALVTAEIERELRELPEVDTVESVSGTGISVVSVELQQTLSEAEIAQVWSEARDAVEMARAAFPPGVQAPDFNAEGISAYSAVVAVSLDRDDMPLSLATRYADGLAERLRTLPGTRTVESFGAPPEEVLVTVDVAQAAGLGLTADAISAAIERADGKVQAGRLQGAGQDITLGITGEIDSLDRLRSILLRQGADGATVRLGDIARITRGVEHPAEDLALMNGRQAILIGVLLQDGLQIDTWMDRVRTLLEAESQTVPAGLTLDLAFDQSGYTLDRLAEVGGNMALGIGLVIAVLFLTLGLRAAAIVALILPVVTLATLFSMNLIGLPIHQMSVTGLIVALGLLVDAAIVMSDEIRQRLARGMARVAAVGEAVHRLAAPLLASTITTALSFTPMILLPGPAGDFVGAIAIAVVLMLVWSLVLALTVTPALAGWLLPAQDRAGWLASGIRGAPIARAFHATLRLSLRHPVKSIAIALILPVSGFLAMPTLTAQFFPGVDRNQFHIEVELPAGASLSATRAVVDRLDAALARSEGVASRYWTLGRSAPAFYYNITGGRSREPGYAHAMVTTHTAADAARLVRALQADLPALAPEARVILRGLVQGPPVNAPVELRFEGQDIAALRDTGATVAALAADLPFVTAARTTITGGAPLLRYVVDEDAARAAGLEPAQIARQMEAALSGVTGGSLLEGTERLPVRVRMGDARTAAQSIADLPILPPDAQALAERGAVPAIPLSALASPVLEPADSPVTRRNGVRANTVQVFISPDLLPATALAALQRKLDAQGFATPPGITLAIGGDVDARDDTVGNLMASVGLIVTLTLATVALTFNSFRLTAVTMVVAGLSAGLSILALAIFQYPFGITAIIGVIGSIGVSINAAIIILTGLQADAAASQGDRAAMADVVARSGRHITSTTVTTVGGFLPLIVAGGGFWPPFAMAVAGGVALSTVVSFYCTPAVFALIHRRPGSTAATQRPNRADPPPTPLALAAE